MSGHSTSSRKQSSTPRWPAAPAPKDIFRAPRAVSRPCPAPKPCTVPLHKPCPQPLPPGTVPIIGPENGNVPSPAFPSRLLFVIRNKIGIGHFVTDRSWHTHAPEAQGANAVHRGRKARYQRDRANPYRDKRCAEGSRASKDREPRARIRLGERDDRIHPRRVGHAGPEQSPSLRKDCAGRNYHDCAPGTGERGRSPGTGGY
jgi:hypothetical protein